MDIFLNFSSGDHFDNRLDLDTTCHDVSVEKECVFRKKLSKIEECFRSGRLISTRDLIKLCKRSGVDSFQVSSTECAYLVFQNAVDTFCSHLAHGKIKTELIVDIGAKLGIIQSRCEHLANENKPDVQLTRTHIKVGRSKLVRRPTDVVKKARIDDIDTSVFSFTRVAACLLERVAICVVQNDPVLLCGETGVGKTTAVQYLAQKMHRKLVVVNLNNQSDVSDLIGGFKPVELGLIIGPLRCEFEALFRCTFDVEKNTKFLTNVSTCINCGDFPILVKLMLKVVEPAIKKSKGSVAQRWLVLSQKLQKLHKQLTERKANICFAFITGALVNCIQNGNWILLDEINLASTETLEYLSTILEPNGSLVLLERGDYKPIARNPNFRVFACMNPSTDVGKKDLPQGIRNRFTELFVDELTSEADLKILVHDYLTQSVVGMHESKLAATVKLYQRLKKMSALELNDGLGNRPTFSLRTLCRALNICAKNLCGSAERNLFESFCLSFLTQLDTVSREKVEALITTSLLGNSAKAVLAFSLPKPDNTRDYISFEGYWIEKGSNKVQLCQDYILTDTVKKNLKDLARIVSIGMYYI